MWCNIVRRNGSQLLVEASNKLVEANSLVFVVILVDGNDLLFVVSEFRKIIK